MNLSAIPNTPIRTPQPRSSTQSLQLTPIWEEIVKNQRLPHDINPDLIFNEISLRLQDLEWPVRQHALRVLFDILPVISQEQLDEQIPRNNIFYKLVVNLGHSAPGIRKVASETIQKFLMKTAQTEKMLEDFLQFGLTENVSNDEIGILRENITLGTIVTLGDVLEPFIQPKNGGYSLSQSFLMQTVEALVEQTKNPSLREKSLKTLWKVKEMVGDTRFYCTLDSLPDIAYLMSLKNDSKNENAFDVLLSPDSFDTQQEGQKNEENFGKGAGSEDFLDGTDTETYTKEPAPDLDDDAIYPQVNRVEVSQVASFVPTEHSDNFLPRVDVKENEEEKEITPKVVLEAEIQFTKNKEVRMKFIEDEEDKQKDEISERQIRFTTENGDLVMKVLHDSEEEEKIRTPRRVRFGGEVVKLRTPDSDTTDITIEIHETVNAKKEPTITITPEFDNKKPVPEETKTQLQVTPSREASPSRSKIPILKENSLSPKSESFDSVPSSSGSEGDAGENWGRDDWKWGELLPVEGSILEDLKNKENWKIQYQALEQLKVVLINPKTIERIGKAKNYEKLVSLVKCLLHNLPQSDNQQVTTVALSIVSQLIETLPKEFVLFDVEDIVRGLCRYFGGCKNLSLKIVAIQSLKTLFGTLKPSAVIDVLVGEGCLFSSSSKLRENSLLAIMYATMMFPRDMFDIEKILEKVAASVADIRRRVRHAGLEAIAVLSQLTSSRILTEAVARVTEKLSTAAARAQFIAAVQARLSRRLLPKISYEGLVLYGLQIPASRRFGNSGNPKGADVDWILSGTGSVSNGSAKSKTQVNAAQLLHPKSSAPFSPNKWVQSERTCKIQPAKPVPGGENPWKIQKQRTECSTGKSSGQGTSISKTQSTVNLADNCKQKLTGFPPVTYSQKRLRPKEITWALIPISALEDPILGRERSNSLWVEEENSLTSSFGPLRPVYLKLQPTQEKFILNRSSDEVKTSYTLRGGKIASDDFAEIRLLTPTILREKNNSENYHQNGKLQRNEVREFGDAPTRIPIVCSNNVKNTQRAPYRTTHQYGNNRKISDLEGTTKPPTFSSGVNGFPRSSTFLPSIHDNNYSLQKSALSNKFEDVDEMKLQDAMTQLSELLTGKNAETQDFYSMKNRSEMDVNGIENVTVSDAFENKIQSKTFNRSYLKNHETLPNADAPALPVISTVSRDQIPSSSSSYSTDFETLIGSELRVRRLINDASDDVSYKNYANHNPKLKGKKISPVKHSNKVGMNGASFPENLKPFERPKEGLDTCFGQLESQQWEVNMLGLTSLVRLLRHHPAIVLGQLHPIIVVLGRQIRNLRSQVARVACQASAEMFLALKRSVEPNLEELSGPLFHRSADTNRFIKSDCNNALDNMVDNVGHAKAVSVIISKGTSHQNATVKAVAARLLLRLSERAGAEKLLSLPKETRDRMLQAGANLLTEGKLETRAFAKQVFRVWSSHPSFSNLILEAVQPNVMRHISKTLISLKS